MARFDMGRRHVACRLLPFDFGETANDVGMFRIELKCLTKIGGCLGKLALS